MHLVDPRQGEALGLRWEDVDFRAGTLRVSHQLQRIEGKLTLVPPKTEKSRRTLVLPAMIIERLREHEKRQVAERLWAGSKWNDTGLVFANRHGDPTQARRVIEQFHEALRTQVFVVFVFMTFGTRAPRCCSYKEYRPVS